MTQRERQKLKEIKDESKKQFVMFGALNASEGGVTKSVTPRVLAT